MARCTFAFLAAWLRFRMLREFLIAHLARRASSADVFHLLRLQRTPRMLLHCRLPLLERWIRRRRRSPRHQRPPVMGLRLILRLLARLLHLLPVLGWHRAVPLRVITSICILRI